MARMQHTPTLASLEEAITVLFCLIDDADAVMDFFTDDAVVKLEPPPPEGGSYNGKEQIRDFVRDYIRDFHAKSRDHRETEEGKMSWASEVNAHPFGGLIPSPSV